MQISIHHRLSLELGSGLSRAVQHLLLTPQSGPCQAVREWHIDMPGIDEATGFYDAFGNRAHLASQTKPEAELLISVSGVVETHDRNGVIGRPERDPVPALFRRTTPLTEPLEAVVGKMRAQKTGRIAQLHALMERVGEVIGVVGQTQGQSQAGQEQEQSTAAAPAAADYAHAFIGAARALDIPARYVTGYWSGEGGAPAAFHAWAEAFDESLGWIGFDAMHSICPTERHVRVACGLDALSAAPVRSYPASGAPQHLTMQVEAVAQ